jgi:tetratricopeptide (TPR) repeat protein
MLTEEALIVLAAFVALGVLVLGIWNFLSPARPKHPVPQRPPAVPRAARPHRQSALTRHTRDRSRTPYVRRQAPSTPSPVVHAPLARSPVPQAPLAAALRVSPPAPEEAVAPPALEPLVAGPIAPAPAEPEVAELVEPLAASPVDVGLPVEAVAPAEPEVVPLEPASPEPVSVVELPAEGDSLVETCFALYQEQRYAEVIERAAERLDDEAGGDPREKAALWSIVALARQALGEDTGARTALESAIAVAPDTDRPTYERQLASLAETVAQGLMAEARRKGNAESDDTLGMLRSAVAWLERGATAVPNDTRLDELLGSARAVLWPAWERTVMALAQRQDFRGARRLLREALADPAFPAARSGTFKELFSGTFSGELGQLTAQAIRSMQEARESDALASLERAETLLGTLNEEALPRSRREEVDRRLWWGYNKLGARRLDAGEHESALEPLLHALGYDVGPARRQETIALLVRALDGVADARALAIRELADSGDREAALVQCDKLWALLRSATEMGLTQGDLVSVFGKAQRLFENLGHPRA